MKFSTLLSRYVQLYFSANTEDERNKTKSVEGFSSNKHTITKFNLNKLKVESHKFVKNSKSEHRVMA